MDLYTFGPVATVLDAAYSLITGLSAALHPFLGASSSAITIILITLLVRAVLIPVGLSQARANQMRARLAPQLAELQRLHGKDREKLQRATMKLYADEKASPLAGCLPMLAQIPVVGTIYALFILPTINGHPNSLLSDTFFGIPLGSNLVHLVTTGSVTWPTIAVFAVLIALIATVAQLSRTLLPMPVAAPPAKAPAPTPGMPDLSGLTRILSFMPFMTAVVAVFVPLAAGLYLLITVSWSLGERLILRRIMGTGGAALPAPLPS
ncbi:YidC/Oxa1 family membrane protein insertase [Leifsonia kafniensis]|uniref:Membrane protein insertase YidC n=1 Tax=Leifsonia kafniensis TaxID=475957 RepID=A0ABP7KN41_9MICO